MSNGMPLGYPSVQLDLRMMRDRKYWALAVVSKDDFLMTFPILNYNYVKLCDNFTQNADKTLRGHKYKLKKCRWRTQSAKSHVVFNII